MSQDLDLAFQHPEARAAATAPSHDRISLRDHVVEVEIGAFQAERGVTQRISLNIVVEVRPVDGPLDDNVDLILSYDKLTEAIAHELAAERLNLLETLAERIADRILQEPAALRVFLRIEKLDKGVGVLGVEIERIKADHHVAGGAGTLPPPRIVFLSNAAVASGNLAHWMAQLHSDDTPTLICVDTPEEARPKADDALSDHQITLLAVEQNAWILTSKAPHCKVVETRTEIDWALRNGQLSVWAPGRLVQDAVQPPEVTAPALARWLADQYGAVELVCIGAECPDSAVPTRHIPVTQDTI